MLRNLCAGLPIEKEKHLLTVKSSYIIYKTLKRKRKSHNNEVIQVAVNQQRRRRTKHVNNNARDLISGCTYKFMCKAIFKMLITTMLPI